jgi:choline-sulfatase
VVLLSDQHSPHVGGYAGDIHARTPNLDRLAGEGTRLARNYCPAPLCVPSRMSLMTGQFPSDLRVWTNSGMLSSNVPTFAHQLARAGYETVLCGRMHFVGPDQRHGFGSRLVGDVSGAVTGVPESGTFEGVWDRAGCGQSAGALADAACGPGVASYEVYDRDVTARAEAFLAEWGAGDERPFCLVVGMLLPHNPYVCDPELFAHYLSVLPEADTIPPENEHPAVQALRETRGLTGVDPREARRARAAYYGLVETADANVGRVLAALERAGLAETTHVVYTSDHGDLNGEHGMWAKSSFYEGSVGVPCIWRGPGVQAGAVCSRVTSLLDLAPTLLDVAGAEPLPAARGRSWRRLLAHGTDGDWPDCAFAESCPIGLRPARMVREGRWKLAVYHGFAQPQLFDLVNDPGETRDLGGDPAHAAVRTRLEARVRADWDGEWVERNVAGEGIVRQRNRLGGFGPCERWPFPPGANARLTD